MERRNGSAQQTHEHQRRDGALQASMINHGFPSRWQEAVCETKLGVCERSVVYRFSGRPSPQISRQVSPRALDRYAVKPVYIQKSELQGRGRQPVAKSPSIQQSDLAGWRDVLENTSCLVTKGLPTALWGRSDAFGQINRHIGKC